jgi:polyhydroxybutyrate depolymerase
VSTVTIAPRVSDYDASLSSGGLTRTYHVHLPPAASAGKPLPLLLALHGRLGDGAGQAKLTGFNAVTDQYGFIVVYPDGYQRSWADGRGTTPADRSGVDDVAFLGAILDQVMASEKVDASRVYAAGMSNGGFMTERLGCDLARRFAAIGIVAANFDQKLAARCAPSHPLPVLLIHGSDDPLVPEAGGPLEGEPVLSTADTVARWAALASCHATPAATQLPTPVDDGTSVTRSTYSGCAGGARVVYYDVSGGGHTWPGGFQYLPASIIGKTSHNLDASATIWQFFQGYHL